MKNPNGFGSVFKLSGKRRKPWAIRVTVGWDYDRGKVKRKRRYLGYYETRREALEALASMTDAPKEKDVTFADLHEKWTADHYPTIREKSVTAYETAWISFRPLYRKMVSSIALSDLQKIFDTSGKNAPSQRQMKSMLSSMYKYAERNDIPVDSRVSLIQIKAGNPNSIERTVFAPEEIQRLWDADTEKAHIALMLIYSGLRSGELFALKREDVNLDRQCLYIRKAKTAAGVREVPIADKVLPFFREQYEKKGKTLLVNQAGHPFFRDTFRDPWKRLMASLGMEHRPHDTRHTFISMMVQSGIDQRIVKQIVGHAGQGVTDNVYTHISLEEKLRAVNVL